MPSDRKTEGMAAGVGGDQVVVLTAADQKFLASLDAKLQMVRDYTASVAGGLTTGFYVYGPGGWPRPSAWKCAGIWSTKPAGSTGSWTCAP